jgi:hypothetical protein
MSKAIEAAIRTEKWERVRQLIRAELKEEPDSHWLLTRLSLTYYEEQAYRKSLSYSRKALKLAPRCPRALWDYAGCLQCSADIAWLFGFIVNSFHAVSNKSLTATVARDAVGRAV